MRNNKAYVIPIFAAAFFFAFHVSLPLYINSSFLGSLILESAVGVIYTTASLATIALLAVFPVILSRFGNVKTTMAIILLQMALLLTLAFSPYPALSLSAFVLAQVIVVLGMMSIDIFLERFSKDETTGLTRGILLTVVNLAILLGPISAGLLLSNGDFFKVYLAASLLLAPVFFMVWRLRDFKDPVYEKTPFFTTLGSVLLRRHPNDAIRHAVIANFLLQFFFSWMVIYMPIYLNKHVGFSWGEIGVIFGIMLLPFVLLGIPVGRLVDTRIEERHVVMLGFSIVALFTASFFFIKTANPFVWAALLFGSRMGATFIETATESYFWKHVGEADTKIVSVFRNSSPLAFILAPATASILISFTDIRYLFMALPFFLVYGAISASYMGSTRKAADNNGTYSAQSVRDFIQKK